MKKINEYRIDFVQLESGNIPFEKFLDSLNKLERSEVLSSIEEFREYLSNNQQLSPKISKPLRNGIYELKINHLNRTTRAFYFFQIGRLIIFTHGLVKKTNKTPNEEIEKAIKYKKIYESLKDENQI